MKYKLYRSGERGLKDIGWLKSNFTFSFSGHYDPTLAGFGLLRVLNDDFVATGNGFGIHPHTNMEIISVMLAGTMSHIDSLGYKEVVEKDWVQIMSAGSGLRHEEHNVGSEEVNFLQIWIEPKVQNIAPRYQRRHFPAESRQNKLVTIVSNEEGQGHCWINQNAKLSLGQFDKGQQVPYTFNPVNKAIFIFVISGCMQVDGQPVETRDGIGIWDTSHLEIDSTTDCEFLLIEVPVNS
ncbi:pirin family protein [Pontibacter saemangeumensis]|uniref:Pirin family protein n=1 Tax=Pontibacter saemangeumensis TaxID=1084525 RepID=A0ABP8LVH0_9BACT